MIECISTIRDEKWFKEKPWLICGTGETLEHFDPKMIEEFNLWVIYCAIDITKYADVFHYQDVYVNYYPENPPRNYRYSAQRPINHMISQGGYEVETYPGAFKPERPKNIYYDMDVVHNGVVIPRDEHVEVFPISNTTSFAFNFLCRSGLKEICTLGIDDGTTGVAKGLNQMYQDNFYRDQKTGVLDLVKENAGNNVWCDRFNVKWRRL